jgi:citrate lyase subunit beta/citryl-CoA lyase
VAYGDQDFTADIGATVTDDKTESLYARQRTVVAAAAAGVDAIDTVWTDIGDTQGLREQAEFAVDIGFDGKLAIHPDQIPVINDAFTPTSDQLEWAEAVLAGQERAADADEGVFTVDGQMIDPPLVERARTFVERAEAAGLR